MDGGSTLFPPEMIHETEPLWDFTTAIVASGSNSVEVTAHAAAPIPEPGTWLLVGTGVIGGMGYISRRRMK